MHTSDCVIHFEYSWFKMSYNYIKRHCVYVCFVASTCVEPDGKHEINRAHPSVTRECISCRFYSSSDWNHQTALTLSAVITDKMSKRKKDDDYCFNFQPNANKINHIHSNDIRSVLNRREIGQRVRLGTESNVKHTLYSSIRSVRSWNPALTTNHTHHGAIFNFDFSTDG